MTRSGRQEPDFDETEDLQIQKLPLAGGGGNGRSR